LGWVQSLDWQLVQEPEIEISGWKISFFIEARWIYDIYRAIAPDGRVFNFCPRDKNSEITLFLEDVDVEKLCIRLGI